MEYRTLGKTGLKISRMGFGGIPIQKIDEEGTKKLLHAMAEKGINYIDSARGYTVSEQYIGWKGFVTNSCLQQSPCPEQKKQWQQISRQVLETSVQII